MNRQSTVLQGIVQLAALDAFLNLLRREDLAAMGKYHVIGTCRGRILLEPIDVGIALEA